MRSHRLLTLLLPLPLALPLLLAWLGRFDGLYGQDPYAYFDYAVGPLLANVRHLHLPPPFFWPPGYPLLLALASLCLGPTPLAGQVVSLGAGLLVPIFTALLAHELGAGEEDDGWGTPLLAGLLAALVGQLWQSSLVVMADVPALAAATVGMWALARHSRQPHRRRWLVLAAAALALAVLTRWAYALVAVIALLAALWHLKALPRPLALRQALLAALVVAVLLAPLWLPLLTGATDPVSGRRAFAGDLAVYSWNPLNAFRRQFTTADGLLVYNRPNGLWYGLAPAHRFYFTPLLAPFLPLGAWAALWQARGSGQRHRSTATLLLIGWPLLIFGFHAGAPWQNFRFNLAHLPPLAILVATGIRTGAGWLGRLPAGRWRQAGLALLAGWVLVGMAAMGYGGLTLTREFIARKNADLTTVRWLETQTGPDADLFTFNLTATFRHYGRLPVHDLYALDPADLPALLGDARPDYLLIDLAEIEGQWQNRAPSLNYHRLRDEIGLVEVGRQRSYTLFRLREEG